MKYFQLPFFDASPVAEAFKAELRNAADFRPRKCLSNNNLFYTRSQFDDDVLDILLRSILQRLAETVIFDMTLAYERNASNEPVDNDPLHLSNYRRQLDGVVSSIPPFEPDDLLPFPGPGAESEDNFSDCSRKRVASVEIAR